MTEPSPAAISPPFAASLATVLTTLDTAGTQLATLGEHVAASGDPHRHGPPMATARGSPAVHVTLGHGLIAAVATNLQQKAEPVTALYESATPTSRLLDLIRRNRANEFHDVCNTLQRL